MSNDSEATISESEWEELGGDDMLSGYEEGRQLRALDYVRESSVLESSDEDVTEVPLTQTKTTEIKSQSELEGNRSEQVKETGMSSKSKGKEVVTEEWLVVKARQLKVEPTYEAVMEKSALTAGLSVERYQEYISGLHHERFDQPEHHDPSVLLAKKLQAEFIEEEKQALKEEQIRIQADQQMGLKIQQEQARISFIQQNFTRRRWKRSIIHLEGYLDKEKVWCRCTLQGGEIRLAQAERMYTLGMEEWKQIAKLSIRLKTDEQKAIVMKEVAYNVNAAHMAEKIGDDEFREFCTAHNLHTNSKSLGLESQDEHPIPTGLVFKNRSYIKTNQHEGLFYKDCDGAECFQDIKSLYKCSLYHCIALMNECKKDRCLPFRERLISWLFNNLLRIQNIGGVDDKVELIKKEYQRLHNKTDEEMEKLNKWKLEHKNWVKSSLQQSMFQAPPKAKAKRRRR